MRNVFLFRANNCRKLVDIRLGPGYGIIFTIRMVCCNSLSIAQTASEKGVAL